MKVCTKCKCEKDNCNFHKRKSSKDGLYTICKQCKHDIDKTYRELNKEILAKKSKERREQNKEKYATLRKEKYKLATSEEVEERKRKKREYNKRKAEEVKERKRKYDKEYFASEKGKITTAKSVHKRRAQKLSSDDGTVTSQALTELKEKQKYRCRYCNNLLDFSAKGQVHLDHIIPLSKGGIHSISNVAWACSSCNLRKSNTLQI